LEVLGILLVTVFLTDWVYLLVGFGREFVEGFWLWFQTE
jgi:hypothetical protein